MAKGQGPVSAPYRRGHTPDVALGRRRRVFSEEFSQTNPAALTGHIPGIVNQPERVIRRAYWRARQLIDAGWRIEALGQPIARYGFIAEVPTNDGGTSVVIFPSRISRNDSGAEVLARDLRWLTPDQRRALSRLLRGLHDKGDVYDIARA